MIGFPGQDSARGRRVLFLAPTARSSSTTSTRPWKSCFYKFSLICVVDPKWFDRTYNSPLRLRSTPSFVDNSVDYGAGLNRPQLCHGRATPAYRSESPRISIRLISVTQKCSRASGTARSWTRVSSAFPSPLLKAPHDLRDFRTAFQAGPWHRLSCC